MVTKPGTGGKHRSAISDWHSAMREDIEQTA